MPRNEQKISPSENRKKIHELLEYIELLHSELANANNVAIDLEQLNEKCPSRAVSPPTNPWERDGYDSKQDWLADKRAGEPERPPASSGQVQGRGSPDERE